MGKRCVVGDAVFFFHQVDDGAKKFRQREQSWKGRSHSYMGELLLGWLIMSHAPTSIEKLGGLYPVTLFFSVIGFNLHFFKSYTTTENSQVLAIQESAKFLWATGCTSDFAGRVGAPSHSVSRWWAATARRPTGMHGGHEAIVVVDELSLSYSHQINVAYFLASIRNAIDHELNLIDG